MVFEPEYLSDDDDRSNISEFLEEFLNTVMTACDSSEPSRNLSTVFQLLPSKRRYPEYYQVGTTPTQL